VLDLIATVSCISLDSADFAAETECKKFSTFTITATLQTSSVYEWTVAAVYPNVFSSYEEYLQKIVDKVKCWVQLMNTHTESWPNLLIPSPFILVNHFHTEEGHCAVIQRVWHQITDTNNFIVESCLLTSWCLCSTNEPLWHSHANHHSWFIERVIEDK